MTIAVRVGEPRRLVSLVPSITETLFEWGVTPVGVTRFCDITGRGDLSTPAHDHSPGAPTIAVVGGTKNPDIEAIVALEPDAVLMDREENRLPDADALEAAGVTVVATAVRSLGDVDDAMAVLGEAAGLAYERGRAPSDSAHSTGGRTRVFVPIWRRPWMTVSEDTYAGSLLEAVGLVNVFATEDERYPTVELAQATQGRAEVVLAPSEPYAFTERHRPELETVAPVVFVDGRDLFWWGVRTPKALQRLDALARSITAR